MTGRERITLIPTFPETDGLGQATRRELRKINVVATRTDQGGQPDVFGDAIAGDWRRKYEVRRTRWTEGLTENWRLVDSDGNELTIEAVAETAKRGYRRAWTIHAVRRSPRPDVEKAA